MDGLIRVSGCDNNNRAIDVVFVHGLDGDERSTWHPSDKPDEYWPAWLGADLPDIGVWSLGYQVNSSAWKGTSMPLSDRATHTLAVLETMEFGCRPIVFICHSLGGLLVKQLLRHAHDLGADEWKPIVEQTRGIVFLSTPHSGADMANWIKHIGKILRTTVTINELKAHDPRLRELNTWYRNNAVDLRIKTQAYCEKRKIGGILVVNETSADPHIPGVVPVPLDDDHISICKPVSKESLQYLRVRKFVKNLIQPQGSQGRPQGPQGRPQGPQDQPGSQDRPRQSSHGGALDTWYEKLEFLQKEEAVTADPMRKFALQKEIERAKQKIRELEG